MKDYRSAIHLISFLLLIFFATSSALATTRCPTDAQLNSLNQPPFWIADYQELTPLRKDQKTHYFKLLERLHGVSKKIEIPDQKTVIKLSTDFCGWEEFRLKTSLLCNKHSLLKICSDLRDARTQTLQLGQARPTETK